MFPTTKTHKTGADYFGQEHWATTRETHFVELPPKSKIGKITKQGRARKLADDEPVALSQYRNPSSSILNMTLTALSCAPRVFEIRNFLSHVEVQHILDIAGAADLKRSGTGDDESIQEEEEEDKRRTRTSFNSWVPREESPIIDAIYRRAADLQLADESLMRVRDIDERPDVKSRRSLTEHLQLVHYEVSRGKEGVGR